MIGRGRPINAAPREPVRLPRVRIEAGSSLGELLIGLLASALFGGFVGRM